MNTEDDFLELGIVQLFGEINDAMAQRVITELLYLNAKYPGRTIQLWINSPGGMVTGGMAIYDTINYIGADVQTIVIGMAASMGAFLLSAGTRGKRCALPNAEIMIHQPLGGAQGQETDIEIAARHIGRTRARMNHILARNTGKTEKQIHLDTERDNYLSADEAKAYGLIDCIIETTPKAWPQPQND